MLSTFPATFPSNLGAPFPDFDSGFTPCDDLSYLFEPIPTLPKPYPVDPPVYSLPTPDDVFFEPNPDYPSPDSCENRSRKAVTSGSGSESDQPVPTPDDDSLDPNPDYLSPDSCENPSPKSVTSGSGSDSDQAVEFSTSPVAIPSGSDPDPNKGNPGSIMEKCKRKRMEECKRKRKLSNRELARRSRMRKLKHVHDLMGEVNRLEMENRELTNRVNLLNHHSEIRWGENERLRRDSVILRRRLTLITRILHSPQLHATH